ncbi:FIST signal transduction protein [soil metagenome]
MTDTTSLDVRHGGSVSADPATAARELFESVGGADRELVLFFCSPEYDLEVLGREIAARFGSTRVIGCTTAGEIGVHGYCKRSISGVGIGGPGFVARTVRIDRLSAFEIATGEAAALEAIALLEAAGASGRERCFGLLLADGLSMQEEALVSALYAKLGACPLVGGSAGDETRFQHTFVFHEGAFHADAALFTLVHCDHAFDVFKTEHFVATPEELVVTAADTTRRIVREINGESAAREFARVLGLQIDALTPMAFATHPVVVRVAGELYVRSIQKVNDDESLTFFCAIDDGIVLTVAKSVDLLQNLTAAFEGVRARIGPPVLTLGFDCILRRLEAEREDQKEQVAAIYASNAVTGFATYGEQFNGMHVNQTFTGVAIGARRRDA